MKQGGLILFDIDGTLTRSHNGYIPFNEAFLKTFGFAGDIRAVIPDGNTDPSIIKEIFAKSGRRPETSGAWREKFAANLRDSYARAIEQGTTTVRALPGAVALVRALADVADLHQGIVTGNLEATARIKLEAAGLGGSLRLGAYGSDSGDRAELLRIAKGRWEERARTSFAPERCIIVGDTPKDLAAARENRMRCLLVATGRYSQQDLGACAPDACLPNFADTGVSIATFLGLLGLSL